MKVKTLVFRPTGEFRMPKQGEYFFCARAVFYAFSDHDTKAIIYTATEENVELSDTSIFIDVGDFFQMHPQFAHHKDMIMYDIEDKGYAVYYTTEEKYFLAKGVKK
jgi:hypothetical protein